jgi:GntR family transcriptional regulator
VIPFSVRIREGASLHQQIIYAAKKAIVSGNLRPGDVFPSVRALSRELKINPNTAHKIVAHLVEAGLLETKQGVGTIVAMIPAASPAERAELLGREMEELVVEAKRLGLDLPDILSSVSKQWKQLADKSGLGDRSNQEGSRKR